MVFIIQGFAAGNEMVEELISDMLAATDVDDFEMEAMSQGFSKVGDFQFFLVHQSSMIALESMLGSPDWPLESSSSHHGKTVYAKMSKRNCFILKSVKSLVSEELSIRNIEEL